MEQLTLETISKHTKDKKVTGNSKHGFTKGNSCLISLLTIYDETTGLVDETRAVAIVYLDFRKAFDTVPHKLHTEKLMNSLSAHPANTRTKNWLKA